MGGIINDWITPSIANHTSLMTAFWIGNAVLFLGGAVSSGMVFWIEKRVVWQRGLEREVDLAVAVEGDEEDEEEGTSNSTEMNNQESFTIMGNDVAKPIPSIRKTISIIAKNFSVLFWMVCLSYVLVEGCLLAFDNIASAILLERNYFLPSPSNCTLLHNDTCSGMNNAVSYHPNGDVCTLETFTAPVLPSSINITSNTSVWKNHQYIFNPLQKDDVDCGDPFWSKHCIPLYCEAQNLATEKAGRAMSIPYIFSALTVPFFGYAIDRIGCRAVLLMCAPMLLLPVHFLLGFFRSPPVYPLLGQGVVCALYSALAFPTVPFTVEERFLGMAYGVMTAALNVALAIFPLMIAGLYQVNHQYLPMAEVFFLILAVFGVVVGLSLNLLDDRRGRGRLNGRKRKMEEEHVEVVNKNDRKYVSTVPHSYDSIDIF